MTARRFSFLELPGLVTARPAVAVELEGLTGIPLLCLLDSGALYNRFGIEIAEEAGMDLSRAETGRIAVGGNPYVVTRTVTTTLAIGEWSWDAPVSFCDPWDAQFQLLGQEGFFRYFRTTLSAAQMWVEIRPERA